MRALLATLALAFLTTDALATCSNDSWEQDDACASSAVVSFGGGVQAHNFCDDGADWLTFNACNGRAYTIESLGLGPGADTVIDLYARDCVTLLASDDDGTGSAASTLTWVAPASGSFHVLVRQKDGSSGDGRDYSVSLTGDTSPCETTAREYKPLSTSDARYLSGIQRASDGGLYGVGFNLVNGGPNFEAWLLRLAGDGTVAWQRGYNGPISNGFYSIQPNASGEIFLTGSQDNNSTGATNGAVLKLDASGAILWQKRVGTGDSYFVEGAALVDGGVIAAGVMNFEDGWLVRFDSAGEIVWDKSYGGSLADWFGPAVVTADGGIVAAGGTQSFGAGSADIWVVKLDANGAVVWQKTFGNGGYDYAHAIAVARDGSIFVAAELETLPSQAVDGWLAKLDTNGTLLWQRRIEAADTLSLRGLALLEDGGVAVVGTVGNNNADGWIARFDAAGALIWQVHQALLGLNGVVALADGGIAVTAQAQGAATARVLHFDENGSIALCTPIAPASASSMPGAAVAGSSAATVQTLSLTPVTAQLIAVTRSATVVNTCPCASPAFGLTLSFDSPTRLRWIGNGSAPVDVVKGEIFALHFFGGDFRQALDSLPNACVASNTTGSTVDDFDELPSPGGGVFYLARGANVVCPGTYDEGSLDQIGSRNAEIDAANTHCPP